MLRKGILNPQILSLLARVRHTNTLVIADRGFPFWPQIETIDIALIDDKPSVLDVLEALAPSFQIGHAWMATEFRGNNEPALLARFQALLPAITFEPHVDFKRRVPHAIGLVRTGGTAPYSNLIIESS